MKNSSAVFLGRMNPIHAGHEKVISEMVNQFGIGNSLVIIGSSSADFSLRNYFSYQERRRFIKTIFPQLEVVGLPDYSTGWKSGMKLNGKNTNTKLRKTPMRLRNSLVNSVSIKEF